MAASIVYSILRGSKILIRNDYICSQYYVSSNSLYSVAEFKNNYIVKGVISERIAKLMKDYEDFTGLTEVKVAQNRVLETERQFSEMQELRRMTQQEIQQVDSRIQQIRTELAKTSRGEDRFLELMTQEHAILKEEKQLVANFQRYERTERENFTIFSNAIRDGHERERTYAERTKYWSIIGSICGAVIGIVGTAMSNYLRMKELKGLVQESSTASPALQGIMNEVSETVRSQQRQLAMFISDFKKLLGEDSKTRSEAQLVEPLAVEKLETQTGEIMAALRQQGDLLATDMKDIKTLITTQKVVFEGSEDGQRPTVVYIGKDVESILKDAQYRLEWKMKINALATVAMVYGALAVTIPLLYKLFGGS